MQEAIAAELACGKVKLQPPAAGSSGRPLLIVKARLHKPGATPQAINQFIWCVPCTQCMVSGRLLARQRLGLLGLGCAASWALLLRVRPALPAALYRVRSSCRAAQRSMVYHSLLCGALRALRCQLQA